MLYQYIESNKLLPRNNRQDFACGDLGCSMGKAAYTLKGTNLLEEIMKKTTMIMAALLALFAVKNASANDTGILATQVALADIQASAASAIHTNNLINWKVGDSADYTITSTFGALGNLHKFVASEQGNAIWVQQDMSGGMLGNHKVEILMDRADGHIIEMRQDGQKQNVPDDKVEIISQDATTITVPAGTFEVIHVVAKTQQVSKLEVWANPRDIPMDGAAQEYIESGFLPMTLKLTKFQKQP